MRTLRWFTRKTPADRRAAVPPLRAGAGPAVAAQPVRWWRGL